MTLEGAATIRFGRMRLTSGAARVKVRLIKSLRATVFDGDLTKVDGGNHGKAAHAGAYHCGGSEYPAEHQHAGTC